MSPGDWPLKKVNSDLPREDIIDSSLFLIFKVETMNSDDALLILFVY